MAEQQFYQPPKRRRDQDQDEPEHAAPFRLEKPQVGPNKVSQDAGKTLDKIDETLANNKPASTSDVKKAEQEGGDGGAKKGNDTATAQEAAGLAGGGFYKPEGSGGKGGNGKGLLKRIQGMSGRNKALASAGGGTMLLAAIFSIIGLGIFLKGFQLDHLMSNIEKQGFMRYQVDTDGRSNSWLAAYMILRFSEITDSTAPKDRDNLLFRSNNIDTNKPLKDWWRNMRGDTGKFEQEVFEAEGIKFTSIAYRDGNQIKFRPAVLTINDKPITFNLTQAEIDAIDNGDINAYNGRLREFLDEKLFNGDKEARQAIRSLTKKWYPKWYQGYKRHYLRKDIQNMTGIRDWRFFEKTRDKAHEGIVSTRNKLIVKALPEDTKSGKFIQCIFGITDCSKSSTDPADPKNRSTLGAPGGESCSSGSAGCDTGKDADGDPNTPGNVTNDGSAESGLKGALSGLSSLTSQATQSIIKALTTNILAKLNIATSLVSVIDTLNSIDKNIKSGALSNLVYMARMKANIGIFTTFGIARDQIRTGDQVTASEVNEFMDMANNAGTSQAWQEVLSPSGNTASAAAEETFKPAKDIQEYCSEEHQSAMLQPKNKDIAEKEQHWRCQSEKIGGDNLAKDIENGWNGSIGAAIAPILVVYNKSGLATITGWINSAADAIFGPIVRGLLQATGLQDNVQSLVAWLVARAAAVLGGGPVVDTNSPGGVMVNHAAMGGTAAAESSMRMQGAAATTSQTAALARKDVALYYAQKNQNLSFSEKYLALNDPDSVASQSLFTLTNGDNSSIASIFGRLWKLPTVLFGNRTSAAVAKDKPYALANFAGVETYDMPAVCKKTSPLTMTPQIATNADDLGFIPADELTWELLSNSDDFYDRLYEGDNVDANKVKKVYNCAIWDTNVRGSLGSLHSRDPGVRGPNAYGGATAPISTETPNAGEWVWPVKTGKITQCWNAYNSRNGGRHAGVDIDVRNQPVVSAYDGSIARADSDKYAGNYLIIKHPGAGTGGTDLWSIYEHLSSITVRSGAVTAGQQVGVSGNTGNSTGPHLHFGIAVRETTGSYDDNSDTREPLNYLPKEPARGSC